MLWPSILIILTVADGSKYYNTQEPQPPEENLFISDNNRSNPDWCLNQKSFTFIQALKVILKNEVLFTSAVRNENPPLVKYLQ